MKHFFTVLLGFVLLSAMIPHRTLGQDIASRIFAPDLTSACDFCLASQGISPLEVGSTGVRIDLRYLSIGTLYQDGSKTENTGQELETHLTQQYSFFYAASSRLGFSAVAPIPKRHSEVINEEGHLVTGNQFGPGDLILLGRYKPLIEHDMETTYIVALTGGVKLPTGKTNGRDSEGNLLDAHIQLGTGSTDVLLGVSGFLTSGRVALIANLLAAVAGKGANGHQFGNSLNYDFNLRYKIYPSEYDMLQAFVTLGLSGEYRGREIEDDLTIDDSGGNVMYLSPGLQVFVTPAISVEAAYQYPISHGLNGVQLGEDYRLVWGLQFLF